MSTIRQVVLVARRPDGGQRDRVWDWVRPRWEAVGSIIEGHHLDGPFNRSAAVNAAAALAGDWDVAVIIDSDVVTDPLQVDTAVAHAMATGQPVLAYADRTHISREMTAKVIAGYTGDWSYRPQFVKHDACSSANVIRRDLWDQVGGFDDRFVGWGWEDVAFRRATETIAQHPTVRVPGMLWHLWHPRTTERLSKRDPLQVANRHLADRYASASSVPAMRALLDERRRTT